MFLQLVGVPFVLSFPSLYPTTTCIAKDSNGVSRSSNCSTLLVEPTLVQSNFELSCTRTSGLQTQCNKFDITARSQSQTPVSRKTATDGGSTILEKRKKLGYFENTRKILLANLWKQFSSMNSFDIISNRVQNALDYSLIRTAIFKQMQLPAHYQVSLLSIRYPVENI